nr:unnamed protein product [Digitaria exilis]
MTTNVILAGDLSGSDDNESFIWKISEVWEGGPLFTCDGNFIGMNLFLDMEKAYFVSWGKILEWLEFGARPIGETSNNHPEVCTNVLSKEQIQDLVSMGYPGPPTVLDVLEMLTNKRGSDDLTRWSDDKNRVCCGGQESTESLISAGFVEDKQAKSLSLIQKAGIGGPLVDLSGKFMGMNFYEKNVGTPFLWCTEILSVLASFKKERYDFLSGIAAEVGNDLVRLSGGWMARA